MKWRRLFFHRSAFVISIAISLAYAPLVRAQIVESRVLAGFDSIEVRGFIEIQMIPGAVHALRIEAVDPRSITTEVRGSTLFIEHERVTQNDAVPENFPQADVFITIPTLVSVAASDGSRIYASSNDQPIQGASLDVRVSGNSHMYLEVSMDSVEATCSGGSNLDISGSRIRQISASVSNGCELFTTRLEVSQVELDVFEGGEATIGASDSLIARLKDGSHLQIRGQRPHVLAIDASSGSRVRECPSCNERAY
jgi:hypothetical protein